MLALFGEALELSEKPPHCNLPDSSRLEAMVRELDAMALGRAVKQSGSRGQRPVSIENSAFVVFERVWRLESGREGTMESVLKRAYVDRRFIVGTVQSPNRTLEAYTVVPEKET